MCSRRVWYGQRKWLPVATLKSKCLRTFRAQSNFRMLHQCRNSWTVIAKRIQRVAIVSIANTISRWTIGRCRYNLDGLQFFVGEIRRLFPEPLDSFVGQHSALHAFANFYCDRCEARHSWCYRTSVLDLNDSKVELESCVLSTIRLRSCSTTLRTFVVRTDTNIRVGLALVDRKFVCQCISNIHEQWQFQCRLIMPARTVDLFTVYGLFRVLCFCASGEDVRRKCAEQFAVEESTDTRDKRGFLRIKDWER